ncbi:hypothetical protein PG989_016428 [Apiospora arundinis]
MSTRAAQTTWRPKPMTNTTEAVAATTTFTSLILGVTTNYVSSIVNQNNIQNGDCRSLSSAQRLAAENMAGFFPTSTAAPPTHGGREDSKSDIRGSWQLRRRYGQGHGNSSWRLKLIRYLYSGVK